MPSYNHQDSSDLRQASEYSTDDDPRFRRSKRSVPPPPQQTYPTYLAMPKDDISVSPTTIRRDTSATATYNTSTIPGEPCICPPCRIYRAQFTQGRYPNHHDPIPLPSCPSRLHHFRHPGRTEKLPSPESDSKSGPNFAQDYVSFPPFVATSAIRTQVDAYYGDKARDGAEVDGERQRHEVPMPVPTSNVRGETARVPAPTTRKSWRQSAPVNGITDAVSHPTVTAATNAVPYPPATAPTDAIPPPPATEPRDYHTDLLRRALDAIDRERAKLPHITSSKESTRRPTMASKNTSNCPVESAPDTTTPPSNMTATGTTPPPADLKATAFVPRPVQNIADVISEPASLAVHAKTLAPSGGVKKPKRSSHRGGESREERKGRLRKELERMDRLIANLRKWGPEEKEESEEIGGDDVDAGDKENKDATVKASKNEEIKEMAVDGGKVGEKTEDMEMDWCTVEDTVGEKWDLLFVPDKEEWEVVVEMKF